MWEGVWCQAYLLTIHEYIYTHSGPQFKLQEVMQ